MRMTRIAQPRYGTAGQTLPAWGGVCAPRPRVVIVDDHAAFRRAARELLDQRGYAVVGEADRAAAALDLAARLAPDFILLDVCLGEECGFDVARAITDAHPEIAVVLVSADEEPAYLRCVARCGARGFVPKRRLADADLSLLWGRA
jgi:DNA-binding NarL/FixJ family response regulator